VIGGEDKNPFGCQRRDVPPNYAVQLNIFTFQAFILFGNIRKKERRKEETEKELEIDPSRSICKAGILRTFFNTTYVEIGVACVQAVQIL